MANLNERVMKSTGRHLVTLSYVVKTPADEEEHLELISGFIIEIHGIWFYVTAGHVLTKIDELMTIGAKFDVWRLSDYTAGGNLKNMGIPIHFDFSSWLILHDELIGLDVAVLPLEDLYRRNLEAGNTVPVPDGAWAVEDVADAYWALVGVPYESVTYDGNTQISARAVMVVLEPVSQSEIPGDTKPEKFYGRLIEGSDSVVACVEGMSGGPVFAFRKSPEDWEYVLVGVQSGWYPSSRIVTVFRFSEFAYALKQALENSAMARVAEPQISDVFEPDRATESPNT